VEKECAAIIGAHFFPVGSEQAFIVNVFRDTRGNVEHLYRKQRILELSTRRTESIPIQSVNGVNKPPGK